MNQPLSIDRDSIVEALKRAGAVQPCPRCGNDKFTVLDGYDNILIQRSIGGGLTFGGPQVPAILVACERCGYLSAHALGALGLLPPEEQPTYDR